MWLQNRPRNFPFFTIKHSFCNISWIISVQLIFIFIDVKSLRWIRKFQRHYRRIFCWSWCLLTTFILLLQSRRWFFLRALIHIILINHLIVIILIKIILFFVLVLFVEIGILLILIVHIFFIFLFIILFFTFSFFVFFTFAFFSVFI